MFQETFRSMTERIHPSPALLKDTRQKMREESLPLHMYRPRRNTRRPLRRALVLAAVLALVAALSLSALAYVPAANSLLYLISPAAAQFLKPVALSCEDQGIRMEVLSAMYDEDVLVAYFTLQDLAGDRLDETVDLYNFSLKGYSTLTSQLTHYDPATKTATLRLQGTFRSGGITKNSVGVTSFLSHKTEYEEVPISLDPDGEHRTLPLDMNNIPGGSGKHYDALSARGTVSVLLPDSGMAIEGWNLDFVDISGMGFADGFFHVQVRWHGNVDDHGYVYLRNARGEELLPTSVSFGLDEGGQGTVYGNEYQEYLFQVTPEELEEYQLYGHFWETGLYVEGNWNVTFQTEPISDRSLTAQEVTVGNQIFRQVTVSPLGLTLEGLADQGDAPEAVLTTASGQELVLNTVASWTENGVTRVKYLPQVPFSLEEFGGLKLNGTAIALR